MGGAPTETNEAALLTRPGGQLYAVLGQPVPSADGSADRYQLRLWWKPLVWWIWLGGALIATGATLAMLGRAQLLAIWRARRARKAADRKSGGSGKSVSVSVDLGGRRINKKKKNKKNRQSR